MMVKTKVTAVVLLFILSVSFYLGIVNIVEGNFHYNLIDGVSLTDGFGGEAGLEFEVSDTVVFNANVSHGDLVEVRVFRNATEVYSDVRAVEGDKGVVPVALLPPVFYAGNSYFYRVTVFARSFPIFGARVSDAETGVFLVDAVEANLTLNVNATSACAMELEARVVNADGEPVQNQTVDFLLQLCWNESGLPDKGWTKIGSGQTDANGTACMSFAHSLMGGAHKVRARFGGDGNFSEAFDDYFFDVGFVEPLVYLDSVSDVGQETRVVLRVEDVSGMPLSGRIVSFSFGGMQLNGQSDIDGKVAFSFPGSMGLMGVESLETATVCVTGDSFTSAYEGPVNLDSGGSGMSFPFNVGFDEGVSAESYEPIAVVTNATEFFAFLPVEITATYSGSESIIRLAFTLDGGEVLNKGEVWTGRNQPCRFVWQPSQLWDLGAHQIIVKGYNYTDGQIAEGSTAINVLQCNADLKVDWPECFAGENATLTVSFAVPRQYAEPAANQFFARYRIANRVQCDGADYIVDRGHSGLLDLVVNGSWVFRNDTVGESGVKVYSFPFANDCSLDVRAAYHSQYSIFLAQNVSRVVALTKTQLRDNASATSSLFDIKYVISHVDEFNRTYTTLNNSIEVTPVFQSSALACVPVEVIAGRLCNRTALNESQNVVVSGFNYIRCPFIYNKTGTNASPPWTDINRDGKVDMRDIAQCSGSFGKDINQSDWYAADYCDVVFDGKIDMRDISLVCGQFGRRVNYMNKSIDGVYLEFRNGENHEFPLDSRGCIAVPQGATAFSVYSLHCRDGTLTYNFGVGIELLSVVANCSGVTDAAGKFKASFVPTEFGNYLVRIGLPGCFYANLANESRSWPVMIEDNLVESVNVYAVRSPVNLMLTSDPSEPALNQPFSLVATATNAVDGDPVPGLVLGFKNKDGVSIGTDSTDGNGTASCRYSTEQPFIYNFTVYSSQTATYQNASAALSLDLRYASFFRVWNFTDYEVSDCGNVSAIVNVSNSYCGKIYVEEGPMLCDPYLWYEAYVDGLHNSCNWVSIDGVNPSRDCINGTWYWVYQPDPNEGDDNLTWSTSTPGTYMFTLVFVGDNFHKPCNFTFLAVAEAKSYKVYFTVPSSFEAGEDLLLNAQTVYADDNSTAQVGLNFELWDSTHNITTVWSGSGSATLPYTYPAAAVPLTIKLTGSSGGSLKFMTEPVTLEVYTNTKLLWHVSYDTSRSEHVFTGRLLKYKDGTVVPNQTVKIYLNETNIVNNRTNDNGCFVFRRHFDAGENTITYNVQATFEGTDAQQATLNSTSFDGENYTVCTVTYFQFKPSSNMTTVTVEPHATEVTVPTKTPEEIQQDGQQQGWLRPPEPEFNWCYPWFRLHFIGQYAGQIIIDVGVAMLPGGDTGSWTDTLLREKTNEWYKKLTWNILLGFLATELALWLGSNFGPIYFGIALGAYILYKFVNLHAVIWDSLEDLKISLASTALSLAISVWNGLSSFLPSHLQALAAGTTNAKNAVFSFLCKIIMIPVSIYLLMETWDRIVALGGI